MQDVDKVSKPKRTLIIGGGEAGSLLIYHLKRQKNTDFDVIGILDDDKHKQKTNIFGSPIISKLESLEEVVEREHIEHIILAIPSLDAKKRIRLLNRCAKLKIQTEILPDIDAVIRGKEEPVALKTIDYADLLDRGENKINYKKIKPLFYEKRILISGAGGSIGSEIARQLVKCEPKEIILLGHGENSIYEIQQCLNEMHFLNTIPVIADIQDEKRMQEVFLKFKPDIVYHAAAHKHVPLMEGNVKEAIKNNIIGTKNMVNISAEANVERFIMISTDKTVAPTSVMGATKKVAEWIVQSKNREAIRTIYTVVRFGNVLGSRGSAIPLFWKQIKAGKEVTITHPDMERYFMTIPEASQLVIEAGFLAKGKEIFILKMGTPQKIIDIVNKLIILAGKKAEDIPIKFTGLRSGEKISEDLFENKEKMMIHDIHPKFYCGVAQVPKNIEYLEEWLEQLLELPDERAKIELLKLTKNNLMRPKEYI